MGGLGWRTMVEFGIIKSIGGGLHQWPLLWPYLISYIPLEGSPGRTLLVLPFRICVIHGISPRSALVPRRRPGSASRALPVPTPNPAAAPSPVFPHPTMSSFFSSSADQPARGSTIVPDVTSGHLTHLTDSQQAAFATFKDILTKAQLYTPPSDPDRPRPSHDDPTLLYVPTLFVSRPSPDAPTGGFCVHAASTRRRR